MNRFLETLSFILPGFLVLCVLDALGTYSANPEAVATLLHVVYLLPWFVLISAAVAAGALLCRHIWVELLAGSDLPAAIISGCFYVLTSYHVALAISRSFNNRELGSLLFAGINLTLLALALALYLALRSLRGRPYFRASWAAALCVGATAAWLAYLNRDGFAQLGPWVLAPPVAGGLASAGAYFALRRSASRWRRPHRIAAAAAFAAAIAGATIIGHQAPAVPATAANEGPWSRYVARVVHALTDVDGDGHSSVFAGGDCAPWDATIYPGQFEIPNDGKDNNCVAGDATGLTQRRPPRWHELPADWPDLDLILITVESLRADHTSVLGYEKETTPNLKQLLPSSLLFARTYASSSFTRFSLPALFTALNPSEIKWLRQPKKSGPRIAPDNPWFIEDLRRHGFRTAAVTATFSAFTAADNIGFDRGFDSYDTSIAVRHRGGSLEGFPARQQVDRLIGAIERAGKQRFAGWVHFLEPHYKYQRYPGSPDFGNAVLGLYDSEIWGVDSQIGRLVEYLREKKRLERTLIFISGDHGEEFMEHGNRFHGSNLFEPQVRTLGLLHVPGTLGRRVDQTISFIDVAPTLLNLLKVRGCFARLRGRNLTPLLFGQPVEERPVILEYWNIKNYKGHITALVRWPYKIIYRETGRQLMLFNLEQDPGEQKNLIDEAPETRRLLHDELESYMESVEWRYHDPPGEAAASGAQDQPRPEGTLRSSDGK